MMRKFLPSLSAPVAATPVAELSAALAAVPNSVLPALTAAQNHFGLALLRQVAGQTPRTNVLLSPFSVATALELVLEGAAGPTRTALSHALGLGELPAAELAAAAEVQLRALTSTATSTAEHEPVFTLANALWADKGFALAPAYVARLRQHYQAQATSLDFGAASAALTINDWVSQHTRGKITEIIDGPLSPPLVLVLANACYFKGRWKSEFMPQATRPGRFTLVDGTPRQVPLMHQSSSQLGYQRGTSWQAVRLPYEGWHRCFSMQLFVPDEPAGLPDFLAALTGDSWARWQAAFAAHQSSPPEVNLTMPRFRLEWADELVPTLRVLGLSPALDAGADFTPMGFLPADGGFIDSVLHKTYLAVDEEGTEAAAATLVAMAAGGFPSAPPQVVTVRADHPFFCAIVDDATGAILFAGVVYEPAGT